MCGIVGWVNLEKNLINQSKIINQMTATLLNRGPDASGSYLSKHALLGHRRLIVVDPNGGVQPMSKKKGRFKCTIVYNGELYNTEDLRTLLSDKGYHFNSYSDTEVLLTSYLEYGTECVHYLNGIYSFAIWDERENQLFMARDRLGVKPLFYYQQGNNLIFGSELKALLAHPEISPVIGEEGLMEIFGLGPARSPGQGVFKNIKEVKPGFSLLYKNNQIKHTEYWQLKSKPHREDFQTTVNHVKGLFLDTVERQLISDVKVCTFLSGGLDSSAISAITGKIFQKKGQGRLDTYSVDYRDNDLYFSADEYQPNSDSQWIGVISDWIGSQHHNIIIDTPQLVKALKNAMLANDLPGMADIDSSLYLFCQEVKNDCTVALSGECADEIFGGYPWFRHKEDIYSETFPWSKSVEARQKVLGKSLQKLPLREYVEAKFRETIQEVPTIPEENSKETRIRELFYLNLKWFMVTLLTRKDRMSMANSLEVRVPFADHRLVEYVWNIPWNMKYYNQIEKGLLREALTGILPEEIRTRRKSPYPKTHNPAYTTAVQDWMRKIINNPDSPILQLINREYVKEIVETGGEAFGKPWFGQLMRGPQLIAYLIQVNLWLEKYKVEIAIL